MKKLNETIDNICDWINDNLGESITFEESQTVSSMIFALSYLVAATKETDLEKRIADLEGRVQSQQEVNLSEFVNKLRRLLKSELTKSSPRHPYGHENQF